MLDIETEIIGQLILHPDTTIHTLEKNNVTEEYFLNSLAREVYSVIIDMYKNKKQIDLVTVITALRKRKSSISSSDIVNITSTIIHGNIDGYIEKLTENKKKADILSILTRVNGKLFNDDIDGAIIELTNTNSILKDKDETSTISSVTNKIIEKIKENASEGKTGLGIESGYKSLDSVTGGFKKGDLYILGARPSVGKTAFACNIANSMANKYNVLFFSLEMSNESLVNRIMCIDSLIDSYRLQNMLLTSIEWEKLKSTTEKMKSKSLYFNDTSAISLGQVKKNILSCEKYPDLVIIDYLQLMKGSANRSKESRFQEVSEIARELKNLAKEMNVPIICLSQLSRGVEQRNDKRPKLSDLRESGEIEQSADIVMFLHREDYFDENTENKDTELYIAKNRNGKVGKVLFDFKKEYTKFIEKGVFDDEGI